ncbi:MAG: hypothetical protein QOE72_2926 [Chloroflexota bacterium]|jgi:Rps23 Pro-64 3,4-dihydroxylase Tpa1-like proline 4-hydroxylase|nr:hypothetical protein [Chloroflexota bacterium]
MQPPLLHPAVVTRRELADVIVHRLSGHLWEGRSDGLTPSERARRMQSEFRGAGGVRAVAIDGLLPAELARAVFAEVSPRSSAMTLKRSLRESKYVSAQMDRMGRLAEELIFAFHDPEVVSVIEDLTGCRALRPDDRLYAGGVSLMRQRQFLNPHLDNSHNQDGGLYRTLNLLWYATPDWASQDGGHLELWDRGPSRWNGRRLVESRFNRLVLMATDRTSWHSVSPVSASRERWCVSDYYFTQDPPGGLPYQHVTTFRGRPDQPLRRSILRVDGTLRQLRRRALAPLFEKGVIRSGHYYRRDDDGPRG